MKKWLFLIIFASFFVSCKPILVRILTARYGIYDKKAKLNVFTNDQKRVVFIGMHHIGKEHFYYDVAFKIDSLRNLGYDFLFEGVELNTDLTKEEAHTYSLKMRKIIGMHIPEEGYFDNEEIRELFKGTGLVEQPCNPDIGMMETDIYADLTLDSLVNLYEAKYGVVELTDYDKNTPLEQEYKGGEISEARSDELVMEFRNQEIVNQINALKNNKIAIIYGSNHISGVRRLLEKNDPTWRVESAKHKSYHPYRIKNKYRNTYNKYSDYAIEPFPKTIVMQDGRFLLNKKMKIISQQASDEQINFLQEKLKQHTDIQNLKIEKNGVSSRNSIVISFSEEKKGYSLTITDRIVIHGNKEGIFRGITTLSQLIKAVPNKKGNNDYLIPCAKIDDSES